MKRQAQHESPIHIHLPPISWRDLEAWLGEQVVSPVLHRQLPRHLQEIRTRQSDQPAAQTWRELLALIAVFTDENYSPASSSALSEEDPLMP